MNQLYSLLLNADGAIQWVTFQESYINSTATFSNIVRPGEINERFLTLQLQL